MTTYARIDLTKTNYSVMKNCKILENPPIDELNKIYKKYCRHKGFKSVMPMFDNDYLRDTNDIIGYYDEDKLVAFSCIMIQDNESVEALQFAWDYEKSKLHLGIKSLRNECAVYKEKGYKYLYLGEAHTYKKQMEGFEILGSNLMDIYTIYADHTPKINAYHFAKKMKLFLDKMVELGHMESYRLTRMKLDFVLWTYPNFVLIWNSKTCNNLTMQ